ncbi:gluconate:H+ symporter [Pectinatus cerevisiiphilus]|uniref:GntP family gluconate:H+ symporter/D-serine transporter n=1 Tax=Pectinatus cerevisiiphilus TaxID=86956 RepID=A0A4V2URP5_9FIRM|nr:gluconate:H+ symporter [Pectinatus cerevisiiphilus]TCS78392.1 GntP family gluconate:H+ symporter/D-serine transporter [Pectinatus cerevisiiphilus]
METAFLVGTLFSAILLVVFLIMKIRLHAFISLIVACLYVGLITSMPLSKICASIEAGMGSTLGFLATVLGLGSILGKMLETSGGAERLARTLINAFGKRRANWAMMVVGLITGIPVFFQVGLVLLIPLIISVARATGLSIVAIGVPIGVSLQIVHCMLPPHPAAMAIAATLHADIGKVIILGLIVCIIAATVAGPIWTSFIKKYVKTDMASLSRTRKQTADADLPHFGITLFTVLLPMLIMVSKTLFDLSATENSQYTELVNFIGNPIVALLISAFFAYWSLGLNRGFSMRDLLKFTDQSFAPVAGILLVIGAGGAFNKVLIDSGLGIKLGDILTSLDMSPLLLAWVVAAVMRFSVGSATVAMMTAAGIVSPMLAQYPGLDPAIVALAVGSGAICFSHVTDSGFWIVKEYFNLTVEGALKSYTLATCIASVTAIIITTLLSKISF